MTKRKITKADVARLTERRNEARKNYAKYIENARYGKQYEKHVEDKLEDYIDKNGNRKQRAKHDARYPDDRIVNKRDYVRLVNTDNIKNKPKGEFGVVITISSGPRIAVQWDRQSPSDEPKVNAYSPNRFECIHRYHEYSALYMDGTIAEPGDIVQFVGCPGYEDNAEVGSTGIVYNAKDAFVHIITLDGKREFITEDGRLFQKIGDITNYREMLSAILGSKYSHTMNGMQIRPMLCNECGATTGATLTTDDTNPIPLDEFIKELATLSVVNGEADIIIKKFDRGVVIYRTGKVRELVEKPGDDIEDVIRRLRK